MRHVLIRGETALVIPNTGHNTSLFVYQPPTTDQRPKQMAIITAEENKMAEIKKDGRQKWVQ
ncbi:hypothetical protein J6590_052729 [Homalodisca vitripennis]|nr:hypothetical protein J6590_052729 [Homalodisca vitripennis]